jgi:hypothetical protein
MNPTIIRVIGIVLLIAAAVAAILNLHRVADLRMPWLGPLLMVWGLVFVMLARRHKA